MGPIRCTSPVRRRWAIPASWRANCSTAPFTQLRITALRLRRAISCSSIRVKVPNTLAAHLLRASVLKDYRTIVFTRARITTELVYRWATQSRPDLRERISSYRAGYLPTERRQIEQALNGGRAQGRGGHIGFGAGH